MKITKRDVVVAGFCGAAVFFACKHNGTSATKRDLTLSDTVSNAVLPSAYAQGLKADSYAWKCSQNHLAVSYNGDVDIKQLLPPGGCIAGTLSLSSSERLNSDTATTFACCAVPLLGAN